ncbi:hypothetical protein FQA39_LY17100 [Lamprigera yunnana]|nr:hypothetical protein FQA39_LY17100 [Lamprigera yunnana]
MVDFRSLFAMTMEIPTGVSTACLQNLYGYFTTASTTTTTNRPSPPWLITSQPPIWSTIKPTARPPPPPPKISSTLMPKTTISMSTQTTTTSHSPPPLPMEPVFEENLKSKTNAQDNVTILPITTSTSKKSIDNVGVHEYNPILSKYPPSITDIDNFNYCNPTSLRSIYWNWTRAGELNIQPCPGGTTGFARWRCISSESDVHWSSQTPDLSECRSVWLTSLEQRLLMGRDPLTSITSDLAQVTSSKTLYGGDMMITTKIIQNMAHKMSMDIQTFPDPRQREAIVTEMLSDVVRTGSNLLDSSQHPSWRDLSHKEQMRVATSLLIGLEENAFLLADTVIREKTVDQIVKNIMLSVRVLETRNVHIERFPSNNKWTASNDSIELPRGALLENSEGGFVRLVFVAFDRLEEILQWQPDVLDGYSYKNVSRMLNSKVISASLGKGRHIQLHEPVRLTLHHLKLENVSRPSCVFWDYTTSTWSEEGCHVEYSNQTHTVCSCDHLTNFAILMDVHSTYLPPGHQIALQIITYVGCIISIVCLILAIITFQLFRGLKSDRTTIHCNLCICLLIAELLFLIGIDQTENRLGCGIIAAFLHYFFLCAFVWMFFEGFQLYVMLIEVFESEKSRLRWYYLIAYGLPLIIVGISGAVFPSGYGTPRYCWLRADNYFIYSFVGPVIVVIILNLIFLSMAIIMMCRHANASVSMKNKEHSRLASVSGKEENALQSKFQSHLAWLRGAVILVFLLGLTWTFGFLYLDRESVAMAYIFAALNSLQGFFIFIFHYVQNEKVRKEYRKFVRHHSWLPSCLHCSKPTNGPASSSGSSGLGKERRTSLYAGSNGNPSAPNSHSTDNSVLSPHGTSLQRGWSSRSCNSMNRVGKSPVPTSTSTGMATTLCRTHQTGASTPPPILEPPNMTTLPYIRNFYKISTNNPNLPKSASTWGPLNRPLHWKNISFKSCSRDSGHGGSEQEDSPRSRTVVVDARLNNTKDIHRQPYASADYNQAVSNNLQEFTHHTDSISHPKHLQLPQNAQPHIIRKKNGNFFRATSPWNHTYMEINDGRMQRGLVEDDPVYEEIERSEIQVSDMSDEDVKRQSDMSHQSSRSYGDHRPLIPYSPATDRSIHSCLEAVTKHRLKEHNRFATDMDHYRMTRQHLFRGDTARSLAAVLDGETVVCHLEPPEIYPQHNPYSSRTVVLPHYSES